MMIIDLAFITQSNEVFDLLKKNKQDLKINNKNK